MELIPLLSTLILVSTLVTLILACGSYLAYKMRERRRPSPPAGRGKPTFFRRYIPPAVPPVHREKEGDPAGGRQ